MEFGHRIWCSIIVAPKETLEPSQEEKDSLKVVVDETQTREAAGQEQVSLLCSSPSFPDKKG